MSKTPRSTPLSLSVHSDTAADLLPRLVEASAPLACEGATALKHFEEEHCVTVWVSCPGASPDSLPHDDLRLEL